MNVGCHWPSGCFGDLDSSTTSAGVDKLGSIPLKQLGDLADVC
ncbi:MAG: hypothetical protein ACYCVN_09515 [Acidimicrobiales bacterium]